MQLQMFQAFKEVCSAARGSGRLNTLSEKYPNGATCDEYYELLTKPWNTRIPDYGEIKEIYKVGANVATFTGDRLGYSVWRRKFFAMVHNQRMLVADKALALSAILDTTNQDLAAIFRGLNYDAATYAALIRELERLFGGAETEVALAAAELFKGAKVQITSLDSVSSFRVKLAAYRTVLTTHDKREAEFLPNSQLYREIIQNKFKTTDLVHFHEQMVAKKWEACPEGLLLWLDLRQSALKSADSGMAGLCQKSATRTNTETLNSAFTTTKKLSQAAYLDVDTHDGHGKRIPLQSLRRHTSRYGPTDAQHSTTDGAHKPRESSGLKMEGERVYDHASAKGLSNVQKEDSEGKIRPHHRLQQMHELPQKKP
jgi:hypothetical protein